MGPAEKLSEQDLDFVIRTVATQRQDYEHIKEVVRDKDDLLQLMIEDDRLCQRLLEGEEWVRVSSYLLFTILLRRVKKDLAREKYTIERRTPSQRIPVFDTPQVSSLLADREVQDYLAEMLTSFTRTQSSAVYFRRRGRLYRRTYSDLDMDDMIELSQGVEAEFRLPFYQRIADIALFLIGIFPEYALSPEKEGRPRLVGRGGRSLEQYEEEGGRFYRMAGELAPGTPRAELFYKLAENFSLAKKPLNCLSERYMAFSRFHWFAPSL